MFPKMTLILGGARSGKSHHAEALASERGRDSVLYIATAQAFDEEMRKRIAQHQLDRPESWTTLEAHKGVSSAIENHYATTNPSEEIVLLDCLTLLISNILLPFDDPLHSSAETAVRLEVLDLLACVKRIDASFIVVSNEVGLGLVPPYPLGRAYRDLLGQANRQLAASADEVLFMVAGLPMVVKRR